MGAGSTDAGSIDAGSIDAGSIDKVLRPSFARGAGAEPGLLAVAPLWIAFLLFQRQFVQSFMHAGIK